MLMKKLANSAHSLTKYAFYNWVLLPEKKKKLKQLCHGSFSTTKTIQKSFFLTFTCAESIALKFKTKASINF